MSANNESVTRLLLAWSDGDEAAREELMPLLEEELRRIAGRYMNQERLDHTLQPTALVNELYLRLVGRQTVNWRNRAHFFGFAAQAMRRILVDHARVRQAKKRGDGVSPIPLDEVTDLVERRDSELIMLDDALRGLSELDPRKSHIVELRFFGGLNNEEIGEVLSISVPTVKRHWRLARLWLHREVHPG